MKVTCHSCGAKYNLDENKIPEKGAFVACKSCSTKIRLRKTGSIQLRPKVKAPAPPSIAPAAAPKSPAAPSAASAPKKAPIPLPLTPAATPIPISPAPIAVSPAPTPVPAAATNAPIPLGSSETPLPGGPIALGATSDTGAIPLGSSEPLDVEPLDVEPLDVEPLDVEPLDVEPLDVEPLPAPSAGSAPIALGGSADSAPPSTSAATSAGADALLAGLGLDDLPTAASASPSPSTSIPLGGSDDNTPPPAGMAIPLGGSDDTTPAPAPASAPIALGGSDDATPAPAPASAPIALGGSDDATPAPIATSAPESAPVPSSDDMLAMATESAGIPMDLPAAVEPAPSAPAAPPSADDLFDLPAPTTDAAASPAPSAPDFLNDLPVAHTEDAGVNAPLATADLPTAVTAMDEQEDTTPGMDGDFGELPPLGDLPPLADMPEAGGLPPLEDLPPMDDGAAMTSQDLPPMDEAPGLMDDLPPLALDDLPPHGGSQSSVDASPLGDSLPVDQIPSLDTHADPIDGMDSPTAASMPAPSVAPVPAARPRQAAKKKGGLGRILALVALLLVAAAGGLFAFGESLLGVDPMILVGLATEPPPPTPKPEVAKPKPETPKEEPKEAPKPIVYPDIALENVDLLSYGGLKNGVGKLGETMPEDAQARGLWLWTHYRLAALGDEEAATKLKEVLPKRYVEKDWDALSAAAGAGYAVLSAKPGPAKKAADKVRKKHKDSGHALYVFALTQKGPKQIKAFEKALEANPNLEPATLALGMALAKGKNSELGVRKLAALSQDTQNPDTKVSAALVLREEGLFADVGRLAEEVAPLEPKAVAPVLRAPLAQLKNAFFVATGKLEAAAQSTQQAVTENPQNPGLLMAHLRLQKAMAHGPKSSEKRAELLAWLGKRIDGAQDESLKAQLLFEKERMEINAGDLDAAEATLKKLKALKKKDAGNWASFGDGLLTHAQGKGKVAQGMFAAATRGKGRLTEPRIMQVLGEDPQKAYATPSTLGRLTQVAKLSKEPIAKYFVAKAMMARNNAEGALAIFDELLWSAPTAVAPDALLFDRLHALHRAGKSAEALAEGEKLVKNMSADPRPVRHLIDIAIEQKDKVAVQKWYELLMGHQGDTPTLRAELAGAQVTLGDASAARATLEPLLAEDSSALGPKILIQAGRAWADTDAIKARGFLLDARRKAPSAEIHLALGDIDRAREKYDTAMESYSSALKLDPKSMAAHYKRGLLALKLGEYDQAVSDLKSVVKAQPENLDAALALADTYSGQEKFRDALKIYRKLSKGPNASADIDFKMARLQLRELNQIRPAVGLLKKVVEQNPKHTEAFYLLGFALKDMGKRKEAREALETYVELETNEDSADAVRKVLETL